MTEAVGLVTDLQALQVAGYADRGVGRYVAAHCAALGRAGRLAAGLLAPELPPPSGLPPELAMAGLVRWDGRAEARRLAGGDRPVARHVPAPFLHCAPGDRSGMIVAPHWEDLGLARVVTLHDLIPLRAPQHYLPTPAHEDRYRARAQWVAAADLIVTNSEYTRGEALALLGADAGRVVTVGAGVSPYFTPADGSDTELFRFHLPELDGRPFVVTIGGSDVRKNTERLLSAVGRMVQQGTDLRVLVVGDLTPAWRDRLAHAARRAGIGDRTVLAGPVGDELLRACYRRAVVTVMPSLAEGFGLPVLESAACGTPALASATTALVEAAATGLATFDPTDTESLVAALGAVLVDEGHRAAIVEAQRELAHRSTWEAVAARTVAAVDRVVGRPAPGPLPGPNPSTAAPSVTTPALHLALVGPLPPVANGIAVFNGRLLHALAPRLSATALSPPPAPSPGDLPSGVRHFPVDAFGLDVRPPSFDAVVYTLGNSDGHLPTVEAALRYPGWIWLHEVRLPAIAVTALASLDDAAFDDAMAWLLERSYPGRAPRHAARRAGRSVLDLMAGGIGLVPLLAERCRGFVVNSEVARRLLDLDLAPLSRQPPVHVVRHPCPPPRAGDRPDPEGEAVAVAFGVVSMAKRPDLLVDAAARAECRLVFVGPCEPFLEQVIGDRARLRGVAARVEVTGAVDDSTWRGWLERATVAVQLREGISGETSGAVLEALAAGVPVITNMATAAEYPRGTVELVPSTDPEAVGGAVRSLVDCPERRRELSRAGLRFAADNQFEQLADRLLPLLTT